MKLLRKNYSMFREIRGNLIHETAIIDWNHVEIGTGNTIYPYVTIGFDAQHPTERSDGIVKIGNNNTIREYVSIHRPTRFSRLTSIGDECYIMEGSHVAHDCVVEDHVRMSNKTVLSGHVHVMKNTVFGLCSVVHQFQVIGSYCMIGMNAAVDKNIDVVPGYTYAGVPARRIKANTVGLQRNNIDDDMLKSEQKRYESIRERTLM